MKRSTKRSLYKIFVSLFVVFYTFFPQSIVIGQVIDEISQENTVPTEEVIIPEESLLQEEVVLEEEEELPPVVEEPLVEEVPIEEPVVNKLVIEPEEVIKEALPIPLWDINGDSATTYDVVQLGKTYVAPQNSRVRVIFTKLPENPSKLTITEITLTQEEIDATGAISDKAYDITTDMIDGTFEYDLTLPSIEQDTKVVYAEDRDSILTDLKEIDNEIVNENNSIEIKDLDHFTLFIVTNPGPKLSTVMVNGMPYVSVPPSTNITVKLQVTTSGSGGDNNWRATGYKIDSGSWICINTSDHYSSGTYTEEFGIITPSTVGSYNLSLLAYSENGCTGLVSNEVTLTDAIKVVTSSPSLTPPTLTDNPSDPISLTSVSGIWTNIIGGSGHQGEGTNEIRWGTPAGNYKSGLKFTNSGNQSFNTGNTFYLGMLTHMNWPTNSGTAATGAKLQITLNFNRPDIADAVFLYDFSIEETPNSKGNCPIYQRTLTPCDDKVTFPNSYGTTVFTIGDIKYTLVIDGFVDAYPTGTAVDAFITEEEKDNSAFLVGHLSSVLVERPQITLTKKVNDQDVSAAPGPNLYIGDSVTWQYIVQNTGNVDLTNVTVVDNPSANIDCDPLTEGNQNSGLTLASGASMTCEATGTVVQGQFSNTATVTGTPPNGVNVTDSDSSWYYGIWKPGHIIVQKTTIPAADPTSFTIEATGSGTITGGGIGTVTDSTDKDYEVTPGTYSVTETVPTGWSLTSNDCTNINVAAGETKYCTITNAKNGSITIIKDAQPDSTQSFSFTASQEMGSSSFTLYGVTNDATHPNTRTFSNLPAGAYTVKELPDEDNVGGDWVLTSLTCVDPTGNSSADTTNPYQANINLAAGEAVTCTFTNMMLPKLTITKTVINHGLSYGTDHFSPYKVGTTVVTLNQATSFNPGTYTVSETEDSNYTVTFGGDCDSHGSVTLVAGDNKTCTITNEEKLTYLTLVKTVTNDNGGKALATEWTLMATGPTNISGKTGDASITNVAVNSGVYTLSESGGPSGYTMGNWSCTGGSLSGNQITLSSGQSATCTLTNNDQQAYITVVKNVINNNGGNASANDFKLTLGGNPVQSGVAVAVNPGTYTVGETLLSGYTFTGFSGDCNSDGKITVALGESKTCTLTNDDQTGSITIKKDVANSEGFYEDVYSDAVFSVYLNSDLLTVKKISDEVVNPSIATYIGMDAGYYSLNEVVTDGYRFEGCYIISDETAELIEDNQFRLNNGQDLEIICKNMAIKPQLKITKDNDSPIEGLLSGSTVLYTIIVTAPSNEEIGLVSPPKQTEELLTAEREILLKESSTKGEVQEDNNSGDQSSSVNRQIPPISNESSEQGRGSQPVSSNRDQQSETVQYANHLLGETEEIYLIKNVKVTDILPKGFEYMSGTWTANSSVRGNIKGSITTEPEYNEGLAIWNLGDMKEGEIVTLTYTAKINLLNEPGLYKDIAFVQGDSLLAEKDSGDILGISYDPSEYLHTDTLGDNFVGTKVLVVEPIEEGGEVLGASTALILPKTGAETYITLGAIISMILGIFLLFFKKRKTSILLITFVFTIGIFTLLKPVQTYAQTTAKVSVRLEEPKIGITDREFNITYVALSIPVKPITVQCQYSLDGVNFSNFDISKTTNSGDCKVDQSIVTGSGTYYFRAIASTTDGGAESEVITVKVADKPSPVTEYSKAKAVCTYTLKFKSSTSKVQIFRSDNQKSFYADDTTLITKPYLTVTPNALSTYTDTPADCSKEYYYAVRAVDEYSNVSALVTDNVVTVVEQTQTSTSQESEEVAGEETTTQQEQETTSTGEVAGEETTAQQEEKAETDTKDETKTEEKETEESIWDKYKYLIISVIVVALGSGIYDYIRRKK